MVIYKNLGTLNFYGERAKVRVLFGAHLYVAVSKQRKRIIIEIV